MTIAGAEVAVGKTGSYALVIGTKRWSSWSLRPWLAMRQAQIPFREINIELRRPGTKAEVLRHSPAGKVPILITGGEPIWDSLAILEYLAEAHPQAGLWPQNADARARARSVAAQMHAGFAALREHCPMELLARTPLSPLPEPVEADVRRVVALWRDCRQRFGAAGKMLFGGFTAADAMYAPVASRFRTYLPDLSTYGDDGTARAYVDTLFALPAMAEWEEGARRQAQAGG